MSTLRDTLAAQLARYDEEAFVALANRGLLRRATKDLEKATASVVEETTDALVMAFGEHRIRLDARGPAQATCSCPASGVCQHILAAALTLQRGGRQATPPAGAPAAAAPDPLAALDDALAAISTEDMQRHAGKAGYRWAWQFVQDLEPEHGLRVSGERHLVLAFARPRVAFRFMGGGLDALVADAALSQPAKYRVAALMAWRRQRGLEVASPEPAGRPASASLDLGADHAAAEGGSLVESRARLRAEAQALICECIELGLSHLSQGIHERLATLAVWAQGAQYPRLAMLLRRAADHVELLLDRAGGADEHRLFDELTLASGLVHALHDAARRGAAPARLVGRARTRYEETGGLEVIGIGAHAWRSATGFQGLTMLFWSPADQAFLSCTDARPEGLRGFDPLARYSSAGLWSGLGAPRSATGRRLQLSGAQINHQGRLSAVESTVANLLPVEPAAALRASLPSIASWAELGDSRGSLLDEAKPLRDWAVLEPARFGAARFDATRQVLAWPLHDADERVLSAELAWSPLAQHAIARIEGLAPLPAGTRVVARVLAGQAASGDPDATLVVEPLSLIHVDDPVVDALFFDPPRTADAALPRRPATLSGKGLGPPATEPAPPLPRVLRELRQWLQAQAERGIGDARQAAVVLALDDRVRRCVQAGFTALPATSPMLAPAAALLRANYLCLQVDRLTGGAAIDTA